MNWMLVSAWSLFKIRYWLTIAKFPPLEDAIFAETGRFFAGSGA